MAITIPQLPGNPGLAPEDSIIVNDVSASNETTEATVAELTTYLNTVIDSGVTLTEGTGIDIDGTTISVDPSEFVDGSVPNTKVAGLGALALLNDLTSTQINTIQSGVTPTDVGIRTDAENDTQFAEAAQVLTNVPALASFTDTQLTAANILAVLNGASGNIDADLLTLATGTDSGGSGLIFQPTDSSTIVLAEGDIVIGSLTGFEGNVYLIGANPPSLTSASNFANAAFGGIRGNISAQTVAQTAFLDALVIQGGTNNVIEWLPTSTLNILDLAGEVRFANTSKLANTAASKEGYSPGVNGRVERSDFATAEGLAAREPTITDLTTIRSGAASGATALQPGTDNRVSGQTVTVDGVSVVVPTSTGGGSDDRIPATAVTGEYIRFAGTTGSLEGRSAEETRADLAVLDTLDLLEQPTDSSTLAYLPNQLVQATQENIRGNVYRTTGSGNIISTNMLGGGNFVLVWNAQASSGTTITSDGDAITQINDSIEIQVDVVGGIATLDLQTTNKPAPNGEIIGIGVGNNEVEIAGGDIKFRDFSTFGGGVANQNEVVRLPVIGRAFIRTAAGVSPSIGGIALSTEALVLRTITENPDDWTEITLGQAYSLAQGERLPGDTGTGEIITDNGDGTFTDNRTNTPRTLTQITQAGSAPGDTWLLIDDDLPTAIDENTFPFGIWVLTATPGGMFVWVFTGTLTQWNRNIAYVPNQIAQLIVDDEITTFEAHTRTGDTLPVNAFNFGIEPGVTVGWEDLWTRINSYTNAARIRVVNTLPGGIATQASTPSYDDGRVVQDNDIVILSIPIADVLTTIVDKDTIPPGLYRFRILSPTQQSWIRSERGLQWNSNLIYLQGEVVFNSVGSTNAVETPFRALSTVGVDVEPGVHADTDTFWQRLNPYVGELLEEVEDGLRVAQTGGREQIDLFNEPASGNNATPTSWRLTLNEDEQDTANVATLPEVIASSKWGAAPIGVKPDGLDWDELVTPITHDSVTGTIDGGDELGAAFSHGGGSNLNSLIFTFDDEDERDQVKAQYFLPNVRAIGPFPINVNDAGIISSTVDIGTTQLEVFFESPIGAVAAIAPSDNNGSNLAIYSANRALVKHIEGGTYTAATETLTITSGTGGTVAITDVTTLPATATLNAQVRLVIPEVPATPESQPYTFAKVLADGGGDMTFTLFNNASVYDVSNFSDHSTGPDTYANLAISDSRIDATPNLNVSPFQLLGYRNAGASGGTFLGRVDSTTGSNGNPLRLRFDLAEFSVTEADLQAIAVGDEMLIATPGDLIPAVPFQPETSEYYIWDGGMWQQLTSEGGSGTDTTLTTANILGVLNGASGSIDADLLGNAPGGGLPAFVTTDDGTEVIFSQEAINAPSGDNDISFAVANPIQIGDFFIEQGTTYTATTAGPGPITFTPNFLTNISGIVVDFIRPGVTTPTFNVAGSVQSNGVTLPSLPLAQVTLTGTTTALTAGLKNVILGSFVSDVDTSANDFVVPNGSVIGQVTTIYNLNTKNHTVRYTTVVDGGGTFDLTARIRSYDDTFINLIWTGTGWLLNGASYRGGGNLTVADGNSLQMGDGGQTVSPSVDFNDAGTSHQSKLFGQETAEGHKLTAQILTDAEVVVNELLITPTETESIQTIKTPSITFGDGSVQTSVTTAAETLAALNLSTGAIDADLLTNAPSGASLTTANTWTQPQYLQGGLRIGANAASNQLDDYEEGTWAPTPDAADFPAFLNITAEYTKIGNLVRCWAEFDIPATSTDTDAIQINGVPFTESDRASIGGTGTGSAAFVVFRNTNTGDIRVTQANNTAGGGPSYSLQAGNTIRVEFTYQTDS